MSDVNYIMHMNGLYVKLYEDDRLNPTHISIYFALFKYWNLNRFQNPFSVARFEIMKLAKVKSPNTYSKCIKDLVSWRYLDYEASHNPYQGSRFSLINFGKHTSANNEPPIRGSTPNIGRPMLATSATNAPAVIPSKTSKPNGINQTSQKLELKYVIAFFESEKSNKEEANKFWNHYEANGWLIGGKAPMMDWKAAARNWLIRSKEIKQKQVVQNTDYLHTTNKKNYNESL